MAAILNYELYVGRTTLKEIFKKCQIQLQKSNMVALALLYSLHTQGKRGYSMLIKTPPYLILSRLRFSTPKPTRAGYIKRMNSI